LEYNYYVIMKDITIKIIETEKLNRKQIEEVKEKLNSLSSSFEQIKTNLEKKYLDKYNKTLEQINNEVDNEILKYKLELEEKYQNFVEKLKNFDSLNSEAIIKNILKRVKDE